MWCKGLSAQGWLGELSRWKRSEPVHGRSRDAVFAPGEGSWLAESRAILPSLLYLGTLLTKTSPVRKMGSEHLSDRGDEAVEQVPFVA